VCEEQFHDGDIAGERRSQEWCLAGEIHPRERTGDAEKVPPDRRHFFHPHVRVGAAFEQQLNQLQVRSTVDAVFKRGVIHVHVACFDGSPKRCPAVPVHGLDVGAAVDEQAGDIRVVVRDRDDEGRDVVGVALVHVRARVEQHAGCFIRPSRAARAGRHPARNRLP
jgi:hypothetical protein